MPSSHRLSHPVDVDTGFQAYTSKFCVAVSGIYRRIKESNPSSYARLQLLDEHIDPSFADPRGHLDNDGAVLRVSQPFRSSVRSNH